MLWFDHKLTNDLKAFSSGSSLFYNVPTKNVGKVAFSAPYKGIIADSSVSGIQPFSGVLVNNIWTPINSGFITNYEDGILLFSSGTQTTSVISGSYSVRDFQLEHAIDSEEKLIFETDYIHRDNVGQTAYGLPEKAKIYPRVYFKFYAGETTPWEFGGIDAINARITAVVLSDSQFKLIGIDSLFRDTGRKYFPFLHPTEFPYTSLGDLKTGSYNYNNLIASVPPPNLIFIKRVGVSEFGEKLNVLIERKIWASVIDFYLQIPKTRVY